ncbi:ferritin-like domain-containing protein [Schizophyllum amplum]|uniref:Ferritin-like domain-containing protein n=1 Tax=Schizophyllum amplum TaxID=97359 RepID=A0A550CUY5_9AGAR|nr:ferritin-like domain-containing protein [Auriculariopsis ampla]
MYSTSFLYALASSAMLASALPTRMIKRSDGDIQVLQFADVLEQLESQFYSAGLAKFQDSDFTAAGFASSQAPIQQLASIQFDEAQHSITLQQALKDSGASPVEGCQFNFDAALTDVATMAATARTVELVGVSAYLGAATLVEDKNILNAAASILTIEARHQTVLNLLGGGTTVPASFDVGLTPSEVLAIAGSFISGCDLGIPANAALTVTNTDTVMPGTLLTFQSDAINGSTDGMFCQMLLGAEPNSIALPMAECVVPADLNGPVAIFITSDDQPLLNSPINRATTQLVAGPTMAFVDSKQEELSLLVKTNNAASGSSSDSVSVESVSTQTVSPEEASSILASATAGAGDSASTAAAAAATVTAGTPSPNGASPDGKLIVNGLSTVADSATATAAAASASASA